MSYKKIFILFVLFLGFFPINSSANYENQGFSSFIEKDNEISFSCEKNCIIIAGDLLTNDKLDFSGDFSGNGNLGYGFLVGQQFAQGEALQVQTGKIQSTFDFHKLQFFSQLPKESKIVLVFDGKISGKINNITLKKSTLGEKIKQIGTDFLTVESIKPYTINLRYGTMILGISIVKIFYILFIITILIFLIFGKLNKKTSLYIALSFFLMISFKNLYDYSNIYFGGVKDYYMASDGSKNFYNMFDYYEFTDKSRKIMGIDKSKDINSCKYYAKAISYWPYVHYWNTDFMSPCKLTENIKEANFILLFKQDIPADLKNKEVLYSQNQNYLLKN